MHFPCFGFFSNAIACLESKTRSANDDVTSFDSVFSVSPRYSTFCCEREFISRVVKFYSRRRPSATKRSEWPKIVESRSTSMNWPLPSVWDFIIFLPSFWAWSNIFSVRKLWKSSACETKRLPRRCDSIQFVASSDSKFFPFDQLDRIGTSITGFWLFDLVSRRVLVVSRNLYIDLFVFHPESLYARSRVNRVRRSTISLRNQRDDFLLGHWSVARRLAVPFGTAFSR